MSNALDIFVEIDSIGTKLCMEEEKRASEVLGNFERRRGRIKDARARERNGKTLN